MNNNDMVDISQLELLKAALAGNHGILVAVSKTKPADEIMEVYNSGHKIFGENRVQELVKKYHILPKDIEWHMIGHLQTNKVKHIAPFVHMIHSIDSIKLLKEVEKQAQSNHRTIKCLLQICIADEKSKFGLNFEESVSLLAHMQEKPYSHIEIAGLMGMATFTNDKGKIRKEFSQLASHFQELKQQFFHSDPHFKELSMGMTGDYPIALDEGATIIRIGSLIFGERN